MTHNDGDQTSQVTANHEVRSRNRIAWWLLAIILIGAGGYAGWHYFGPTGHPAGTAGKAAEAPGKPGKGGPQSTPIVAVVARINDVGVYLTGLGSVTPLNTVSVRSRVDGQLMELRFREGQMVKKGDLLAQIDPRPFQVQLTQAEGQLARDQEQLNNARLDLQRYQQLWQQDSIPKQQLDTQAALVRQLEGSAKVDQGQIDSAKLQLVYCRITAPLSGRVGLRQVDPGNMVHTSDANGLVVITQIQPIAVIFPLPEDNLPRLLPKVRAGVKLPVIAFDREQKQQLASGTLLTLDNQIDPTTGTVKLKATFPNDRNELFPNQFVNARLLLETLKQSVTVPAAAIQRGAQGTFVYLVNADSTVSVRPVTLGPSQNDEIVVSKGLAAGERVVIDGAERLRDGSKVEVKEPGGRKGPGGDKGPGKPGGAHGPKNDGGQSPPLKKGG